MGLDRNRYWKGIFHFFPKTFGIGGGEFYLCLPNSYGVWALGLISRQIWEVQQVARGGFDGSKTHYSPVTTHYTFIDRLDRAQ